jgi:hypothetical protein
MHAGEGLALDHVDGPRLGEQSGDGGARDSGAHDHHIDIEPGH